jgi:uncharacterized oligopeptide transporter (OPT) family protein
MNRAYEQFQRMQSPMPLSLTQLPDGVQSQGAFTRDRIELTASGDNQSHQELTGASHYILLNAIGSNVLQDGKYLYNPATGQIEVQWIQGIGSERAAAPQGRLMATVINGILSRKLPWTLVLLGVALVIVVELLGVRSLTFAVGAYLSIATTLAIFVGGVMRWMVDSAMVRHKQRQRLAANPDVIDPDTGLPVPTSVTPALDTESEISPGSLYASGLIAAGGIVGLLGVCARLAEGLSESRGGHWQLFRFSPENPMYHDWVAVVMFALLAFSLYYFARKPLNQPKP